MNQIRKAFACFRLTCIDESRRIQEWPPAHLIPAILISAMLGLFAELLMIRLHASYFQLFAYFKNISMLSCFLGLSIGYARYGRRRSYLFLVMPMLVVQVVCLFIFSQSPLSRILQNPVPENTALGLSKFLTQRDFIRTNAFLFVVFVWNALCFVPLGQVTADLMKRLDSLKAYRLNLLGSLAGVVLFTFISYFHTPPVFWLLIVGFLLMLLLQGDRLSLLCTGASTVFVAFILLSISRPGTQELYSPYQLIQLSLFDSRIPELFVSHNYHQRILDLRPESIRDSPALETWAKHYNFPYRIRNVVSNVLIVGSGTGNDVAAALRHGAEHVDAVEIDPMILSLGNAYHLEKPYQSPRVTSHVTDARSFMRHSMGTYDLIVYGLLDSHSLLSGLSSVRLDSYVYTVEAFREARSRLSSDGVLVLSFCRTGPALMKKLYGMLQLGFEGVSPEVYSTGYDQAISFVIGKSPAFREKLSLPPTGESVTADIAQFPKEVTFSTDDWPFLYMAVKHFPLPLCSTLVLIFLFSWVLIRGILRDAHWRFIPAAFFLGAGFMLLETGAITRLSLQFGNTWVVVTAVISTVLVLSYLATTLVEARNVLSLYWIYGSLMCFIALNYLVPDSATAVLPLSIERLIVSIRYLSPLFFAAMAFARLVKGPETLGDVLSSNILGAMAGGVLEYVSMSIGFRALFPIAMGIYVLACLMQRYADSR